ncbi:TTLL3 monoglycylase, partial [Bucco capensis]|nr:TTLL3 monoglycylase [Bucco capensis]
QEKMIFAVQGPYPVIRSLLRARGWVERKFPRAGRAGSQPGKEFGSQEKQLQKEEEEGDDEEEEKEERQCNEDPDVIYNLMSHLVQDQVPYFIWTNCCSAIDCRLLRQDQVLNHYAGVGAFATKEGLCLNLRNLPWFDQADPNTFFPRCYRLGAVDERQAFIEDFHLTAARSLLKMALERGGNALTGTEQCPKSSEGPGDSVELSSGGRGAIGSSGGHIPHPMPSTAGMSPPAPHELVEEALQVCGQYLGSLEHQDIDEDPLSSCTKGTDWDCFLRDYYHVAHEGARLTLSRAQWEQCQTLLGCLAERLPQLGMEGDHNIWILKPGAKSRGRGIVCTARLEEVLQLAQGCTAPSARAGKWVVQKYLERPLLIFGTKFDVRQWFLVTDWNPLTIWFYQESYLRFCSQPFSLHHLDPARHLCNVSIQKWFTPVQTQHPQLPPDRIWSCRQFQKYLTQVGQANAWQEVMVPGMKAAVVGALRSAQDLVESRKGSFELYGADFLFGEDCQPWLLEINASPTMAPSSVVTSRLCARVQQDTLRVVIDRRNNPACPTGAFELIYKE